MFPPTPTPLPQPPLLLVTDRRQARRPLSDVVAAALGAGCRWISLREKDLPADEQILLARALMKVAHAAGAKVSLHGSALLARDAGVDGAHLPSGSDPGSGRAIIGSGKLLGISVHSVGEAEAIDPALVDYALAGPAFETRSKPGYGPQIGRQGLEEMTRIARVPILAIGGVNAARLGELIAAGVSGAAVMGGVMRAADPGQAISALVATLNGGLAVRQS
jgi:thiamine-phosphate pyrophosphorylase